MEACRDNVDVQSLFLKCRENKSHKNSFFVRPVFDGIWLFLFNCTRGGWTLMLQLHRGGKGRLPCSTNCTE